MPWLRNSVASSSPCFKTFDEKAPLRPRSDVKRTIAARSIDSGSVVRTWSTFENVATAETARVTAREYGPDAVILACAF
ncbi:hypothetical protein GCM10025867_32790 [Frondihabitans sucicola]|uniref:Uncharacterized protein n=1 Tax=Frondihabitans sucicola TaxID=1268041 RepID=A0ABN6Y5J1_9MICO|nr:hypothetical protein GCM10025867_32790 [Frondihabitans sucicola]